MQNICCKLHTGRLCSYSSCYSVYITEFHQFTRSRLDLTSVHHRLVGRGPIGVTLLEVVILFTEFFRKVWAVSDMVDDPSTFFVRAVVGFM